MTELADVRRPGFEAWAASAGLILRDPVSGRYTSYVQAAWMAWNAALEAVVVELPRRGYWGGYDQECYMEADEVVEAIHSAGVPTK
jgi:hypothetical protein